MEFDLGGIGQGNIECKSEWERNYSFVTQEFMSWHEPDADLDMLLRCPVKDCS